MNNPWVWVAVGIGAYLIYTNQSVIAPVSTVPAPVSYIPIANAAGNEFNCPTGTLYHSSEVMGSGQGYCL